MTTATNFAPPFSGPVLNALVGAFDLRRWDRADVLSQKTSRRYLAGERVGDDAEWRVHRAIAAAIVTSDLVPAAFSLPEIPVKAEDALAGFIQVYARQWDQFAGAMRRMSAPVEHHGHAASAYLRLVVIDLAARVGALIWLLRGSEGQLPLPVWCEPRGAGMHLRSILDRCGDRKPSRDEIALDLSINFKTVDGWLDGHHGSNGGRSTSRNPSPADDCLADGDALVHHAGPTCHFKSGSRRNHADRTVHAVPAMPALDCELRDRDDQSWNENSRCFPKVRFRR